MVADAVYANWSALAKIPANRKITGTSPQIGVWSHLWLLIQPLKQIIVARSFPKKPNREINRVNRELSDKTGMNCIVLAGYALMPYKALGSRLTLPVF